jgi:hypothetical protein
VRLLPAALLLVLAAPAAAGPGAAAPPVKTTTYAGLVKRVQDAQTRFDALILRSKQDPRTGEVEAYLAYKDEDFQSSKRNVRVTHLVAILADETAPLALRKRAKEAVCSTSARTLDPDIQYTGTGHSKRASFSIAKVVPLLGAKASDGTAVDETTRLFASEVLVSLWHYASRATQAYDPKNPATWRPAQDDWRKYLLTR